MTEQSESQATSEDSVERVIGDKGCGIIGKICWALILLAAPPLLVVWALNGGSIGASVFLGIVLVIFIRVYISSEIVDAFHNRRKVDTILKRGGPQTREEYLFLFPKACHTCGSRDLIRETWDSYWESEDYPKKRSHVYCLHLFHQTFQDSTLTKQRVYSPFLSSEESDSIPVPTDRFGPQDDLKHVAH